jgi:hypothetical protein
MRAVLRMSLLCSLVLLAYSAVAAKPHPICGEWTGLRPPNGTTRPDEQKWILTFYPDNSFSLVVIEGKTPVPGFEGSYKPTSSTILLRIPEGPTVPIKYSIKEPDMQFVLSDLTTMMGWGETVDKYTRTKKASELLTPKKQSQMKEGKYRFSVSIAKDNDEAVLKTTFGEQYTKSIFDPVDGGSFPIRLHQGKNIIQLPGEQFGPPKFDGKLFTVSGAVSMEVSGVFSGTVKSSTEIKGTFKSHTSTLHGTFVLKRVGGIE